jgi:hypothetical protein
MQLFVKYPMWLSRVLIIRCTEAGKIKKYKIEKPAIKKSVAQ